MQPYQERVIVERDDLTQRLGRLQNFLRGPGMATVGNDEQQRLFKQASVMTQYVAILNERIAAFEPVVSSEA